MIEDIDIAISRHFQSIKFIRSNTLVFSKKASLYFATLKHFCQWQPAQLLSMAETPHVVLVFEYREYIDLL